MFKHPFLLALADIQSTVAGIKSNVYTVGFYKVFPSSLSVSVPLNISCLAIRIYTFTFFVNKTSNDIHEAILQCQNHSQCYNNFRWNVNRNNFKLTNLCPTPETFR